MDIIAADALGHRLKDQHGLERWRILWTARRRRIATCHRAIQTISVSCAVVMLNDEEVVRAIFHHEIAHALTVGGHTQRWASVARLIGGERAAVVQPADIVMPPSPWLFVCLGKCGVLGYRYRRPKLGKRYFCRQCGAEAIVKVDVDFLQDAALGVPPPVERL